MQQSIVLEQTLASTLFGKRWRIKVQTTMKVLSS